MRGSRGSVLVPTKLIEMCTIHDLHSAAAIMSYPLRYIMLGRGVILHDSFPWSLALTREPSLTYYHFSHFMLCYSAGNAVKKRSQHERPRQVTKMGKLELVMNGPWSTSRIAWDFRSGGRSDGPDYDPGTTYTTCRRAMQVFPVMYCQAIFHVRKD